MDAETMKVKLAWHSPDLKAAAEHLVKANALIRKHLAEMPPSTKGYAGIVAKNILYKVSDVVQIDIEWQDAQEGQPEVEEEIPSG